MARRKLSRGHDRPRTPASGTSAAAGTYTLTARATDNAGATDQSIPVTITVKKKR